MTTVILLSIFIAIQAVALMIIYGENAKFFNKHIKDFTIFEILFKPLTIPAFIIYRLFSFLLSGLAPVLFRVISFKPFKKANFKVGEVIIYNNMNYYVTENELQNDGDYIRIRSENGLYVTKVSSKYVRKVSKLEREMK